MELDGLWNLLMGVHGVIPAVVGWLGLICSFGVGIIQLTPWQGDDKALAQVRAIPVLGSLLAFIIGKSPLQLKK